MNRSYSPAVFVALVAFALYRATMLPGVELGDSASFQIMVGEPTITPRDGYPLYFAIADVLHWITGADPAWSLNLASVLEGALACGLIALVATELSGSVPAGAAAGLMFAGSYTFWSQSVIAEVYALHILLIALTLRLALRWATNPTFGRLAVFFLAYAVSFGNHLMMVLLAPAYALFLLVSAPGGWRSMLEPRIMALAMAAAVAGAAQYLWNFNALWLEPSPPATLADGLRTFWFDVTKADWRDAMILSVPASLTVERLRMYAFDVSQQFGGFGSALAIVGLVALFRGGWRRAALMLAAYLANVLFALCYNVGDSYVFFLPAHLITALLAAPGIVLLGRLVASERAAFAIVMTLVAARIHRDYPALDRSMDVRPAEVLSTLTAGLDDREAVLLTDLNWQVQNGLHYFTRYDRPEVAYVRVAEIDRYAPILMRDNAAIGRDIVATDHARSMLSAAYGRELTSRHDERVRVSPIVELVRGLPAGTRYVICLLRPTRDFTLDAAVLEDSLRRLTGDRVSSLGRHEYAAIAGLAGHPPVLVRSSERPFREVLFLGGVRVDVRMDSWLAFDTIRRMGFGHVVAGRNHALIVERGVSFVALDAAGRAIHSGYSANIFEPQPRYLITYQAR